MIQVSSQQLLLANAQYVENHNISGNVILYAM
jgi:hypothetical protein